MLYSISLLIHPSTFLPVSPPVHLSIDTFTRIHIYERISMFFFLFDRLSAYSFIRPYIHRSMRSAICMLFVNPYSQKFILPSFVHSSAYSLFRSFIYNSIHSSLSLLESIIPSAHLFTCLSVNPSSSRPFLQQS